MHHDGPNAMVGENSEKSENCKKSILRRKCLSKNKPLFHFFNVELNRKFVKMTSYLFHPMNIFLDFDN